MLVYVGFCWSDCPMFRNLQMVFFLATCFHVRSAVACKIQLQFLFNKNCTICTLGHARVICVVPDAYYHLVYSNSLYKLVFSQAELVKLRSLKMCIICIRLLHLNKSLYRKSHKHYYYILQVQISKRWGQTVKSSPVLIVRKQGQIGKAFSAEGRKVRQRCSRDNMFGYLGYISVPGHQIVMLSVPGIGC